MTMQISGRNKLNGTVINTIAGTATAEVEVDLGNGKSIVGTITRRSLDEMGIRKGDNITALIKASSVMFIKD